jgi:tetratricopeptide (TPR) repeat protein
MARALAHKRNVKKPTKKTARPAAKAKPKTASKPSRGKPSLKVKVSLSKATSKKAIVEKKKHSHAPHPGKKEIVTMEAESRKAASRTNVAPPLDAPAHLLRQTKTTSAALALLGKGIEHIFQKEFKKARGEFNTLLEAYPTELDILSRARSYLLICHREEAAQKKTVITADQLYSLGIIEHNKGNYDKAISYFHQSLEKHPDADYIYYSIAASLAMKGDLSESIKKLRKAVELNGDSRIHAKNDSDFSALEGQKEFLELANLNPSSTEPQR